MLIRSPLCNVLRRSFTTSTQLHTAQRPQRVPVDEFCIPLCPPYSIASYIPAPTPLPRATLVKLHLLSALRPPVSEEGWKELEELGRLVAIMEGVRLAPPPPSRLQEASKMKKGLDDGRVRAVSERIEGVERRRKKVDLEREENARGRDIMKLAKLTKGGYYVVKTPDGIRGKKRAMLAEGGHLQD